ncbi:hypothetical protein V8G54_013757 [Vigna mungo]|uniref:Uncharacterized protein n=1 Tax=Vigna mungo TaxID=3915 RepID=A0AAQ3RWV0_VIGMU
MRETDSCFFTASVVLARDHSGRCGMDIFGDIGVSEKLSLVQSSDINLVEMSSDAVKDEDKAVLLEGGALQSGSPRARSITASPSIIRFLLMDEYFLLENRLTLRAMSEFGLLLAYFYLCDRTDFFASSKKVDL